MNVERVKWFQQNGTPNERELSYEIQRLRDCLSWYANRNEFASMSEARRFLAMDIGLRAREALAVGNGDTNESN